MFCIGKECVRAVFFERIELGLIHRLLDREPPANVGAELTDVEARNLFANKENSLSRQGQLFIQSADLGIKQAESRRQACAVHFQRRKNFAELAARKVIRQLQKNPRWLLDRWQKC